MEKSISELKEKSKKESKGCWILISKYLMLDFFGIPYPVSSFKYPASSFKRKGNLNQ